MPGHCCHHRYRPPSPLTLDIALLCALCMSLMQTYRTVCPSLRANARRCLLEGRSPCSTQSPGTSGGWRPCCGTVTPTCPCCVVVLRHPCLLVSCRVHMHSTCARVRDLMRVHMHSNWARVHDLTRAVHVSSCIPFSSIALRVFLSFAMCTRAHASRGSG